MSRPDPFRALAILAALTLLGLPVATAQHGPPPGYTDPVVYAQDYATNQSAQASADPAGYAQSKATPEALGNESTHAAWLACWTAWYESGGQMVADPACSEFFTAPGVVNAPQEAHAELTEVTNSTGADALVGAVQDAVNGTLQDPTSAVEQVQKVLDAVGAFAMGLVKIILGIVGGVLGLLGLGGLAAASGLGSILGGLLDGLLGGLKASGLGVQTAADASSSGLAAAAGAVVAAAGAVGSGLASAALAAVSGIAAAVSAVAEGFVVGASAASSGLGAVADGVVASVQGAAHGLASGTSAAGSAVGDAVHGIAQSASDAAGSVKHAVAHLLGGDKSAAPASQGRDLVPRAASDGKGGSLLHRLLGSL